MVRVPLPRTSYRLRCHHRVQHQWMNIDSRYRGSEPLLQIDGYRPRQMTNLTIGTKKTSAGCPRSVPRGPQSTEPLDVCGGSGLGSRISSPRGKSRAGRMLHDIRLILHLFLCTKRGRTVQRESSLQTCFIVLGDCASMTQQELDIFTLSFA